MYTNMIEAVQKNLNPVVKLAENNTSLAVKLLNRQTEHTVKLLEDNLSYLQALSNTKDFNDAADIQKKYVEDLAEAYISEAKDGAADVEQAISEAGKILEGSWSEVQKQVKEATETATKEVKKAAKAAKVS